MSQKLDQLHAMNLKFQVAEIIAKHAGGDKEKQLQIAETIRNCAQCWCASLEKMVGTLSPK